MRFDWDPDKARANLRRHGVSFSATTTVFDDELGLSSPDVIHSAREERSRRIGYLRDGRLVVVTFTERGDTIWIISARRATKRERHDHENR